MTAPSPIRFRFDRFVLSPRQRALYRDGVPVALIPKYFDLLHLLILKRHEAVAKDAIFAEVWSDVVVSDGALSQAVRTLRRTLGDDSREPRFIRTVSRHGYQFVCDLTAEEVDDGRAPTSPPSAPAPALGHPDLERLAPLVDRLLATAASEGLAGHEARDAAEKLHAIDTRRAVARLVEQPNHAPALAVMREARWNVPGSGAVPLMRTPAGPAAMLTLIWLRLVGAGRLVAARWAGAAAAGALGGAAAGALGGFVLSWSPTSSARPSAALALAVIGATAGGLGAAGIGAGLAAAEAVARSRRGLALIGCGAAAGGLTASVAQVVVDAILQGLAGLRVLSLPGGVEGLVLGGAAGIGYALATPQPPGGGLAAPVGWRRVGAAAVVAACCAIAAAGLARLDHLLIGGLVHDIARQSRDAPLVLAPLGRLIGEPDFGPLSRTLLSALEGGTFGGTLCWGLTRRPPS